LDYYPYGSTRISQTSGGYNEAKQFIAQYTDPETNLSYLNARYYDGSKGQFLSEDPTFLSVGNPSQVQRLSSQNQQRFLMDPQQMNSYSYGRGNPITNSDPSGNNIYYGAAFVGGLLYGMAWQMEYDRAAGTAAIYEV
jgi:RHS repeat-associated protein